MSVASLFVWDIFGRGFERHPRDTLAVIIQIKKGEVFCHMNILTFDLFKIFIYVGVKVSLYSRK